MKKTQFYYVYERGEREMLPSRFYSRHSTISFILFPLESTLGYPGYPCTFSTQLRTDQTSEYTILCVLGYLYSLRIKSVYKSSSFCTSRTVYYAVYSVGVPTLYVAAAKFYVFECVQIHYLANEELEEPRSKWSR